MAICIDYCGAGDSTEHLIENCPQERLGGADAVIILTCDHTVTDPSDDTQITANIAAGTAFLVKNVNISYDKATPVEIDSNVPCQPAKVVRYDFAGLIKDNNMNQNNVDFWNAKSGRLYGGLIIKECGNDTNKVKWIDNIITLTVGDILPNNNEEEQSIEVDFKGKASKSKVIWSLYDEPAGIF